VLHRHLLHTAQAIAPSASPASDARSCSTCHMAFTAAQHAVRLAAARAIVTHIPDLCMVPSSHFFAAPWPCRVCWLLRPALRAASLHRPLQQLRTWQGCADALCNSTAWHRLHAH
jgi:hypothetical protein